MGNRSSIVIRHASRFLDPLASPAVSVKNRAMAKPHIFPPAHLKFIHQFYLKMRQTPSEVTVLLNEKYGMTYTTAQVQRAINTRGWSKRKKLLEHKVRAIEVVTDRVMAKSIAKEHEDTIKEVAAGMVTGAKGLPLVEAFRKLRACGFEGVEPNLSQVADPDEWVAASRESGLIIDGTVGARTEKLDDGIALTKKLGGDSMLVVAKLCAC